MVRLVALIALVFVSGCKERNSLFCQNDMNANDPACAGQVDAQQACETSPDCTGNETVCKLPDRVCVECTTAEADACTLTTPICGNDVCRGCMNDDECESNVCLNDGACASAESVLFAANAGSTTVGCGLLVTDPCSLATALTEVTLTRNLIKLKAETFLVTGGEGQVIEGSEGPATLLARGATLDRGAGDGPILTMKNGAVLTIVDGIVRDGTGLGNGHGIVCGGSGTLTLSGVEVTSCEEVGIKSDNCALTISRSRITANTGGGITVNNGTFVIVGNVFHLNGTSVGTSGGLRIQSTQSATNRLDFNSFNKNQAQATVGTAVECVAGTFTARNNIAFNNGDGVNTVQVDGGCKHAFSVIGPTAVAATLDGGNNIVLNPMFFDENAGDLHINSALSPARDMADPATPLDGVAERDIDNQPRVMPADSGADQTP